MGGFNSKQPTTLVFHLLTLAGYPGLLSGYSGLLSYPSRFCEVCSGSCLGLDNKDPFFLSRVRRLSWSWRLVWSWQFCRCTTVVFPSSGISGASVGASAKPSELTRQAVNANVTVRFVIFHVPSFLCDLTFRQCNLFSVIFQTGIKIALHCVNRTDRNLFRRAAGVPLPHSLTFLE